MQRAHYSKRRKEIWEALHPEPMAGYGREDGGDNEQVGKVCPPVAKHGHAQTKGFAAATAEVTGESKRAINLNVARAEAIGDDLLRLTGTSLDKGVELDALAKLPTEAPHFWAYFRLPLMHIIGNRPLSGRVFL